MIMEVVRLVVSALIDVVPALVTSAKDIAAVAESLAKIAALVVAGLWTWKTYVEKRLRFPAAKVEHLIVNWIDDGRRFLRVTLRVVNTGHAVIPIAEGCTWVQQLTPLPQGIGKVIAGGGDPLQEGTTEFGWPIIAERKLNPNTRYEIEPGEPDEFHFDFCIERNISRVLIYSHVENRVRGGMFPTEKIGWNLSTVYEIKDPKKEVVNG